MDRPTSGRASAPAVRCGTACSRPARGEPRSARWAVSAARAHNTCLDAERMIGPRTRRSAEAVALDSTSRTRWFNSSRLVPLSRAPMEVRGPRFRWPFIDHQVPPLHAGVSAVSRVAGLPRVYPALPPAMAAAASISSGTELANVWRHPSSGPPTPRRFRPGSRAHRACERAPRGWPSTRTLGRPR